MSYSGSLFDPNSMSPQDAAKLAALLKNAQSQPTATTPFQNAANAGNQVLNAYLARQYAMQHMTPQQVSITPQQTGAMSQSGYDWMKLKQLFGLGG